MKILILLLCIPLFTFSQIIDYNWIVIGGDVTRLNFVPKNWTIGNPCDVPYYIDVFVQGDLTLKENCYIQNAKLTIYGEVIYNGFTITLMCSNSELILDDGTLSIPSKDITELVLYPNPTNGVIHLNTTKPFKIYVYDIMGKLVGRTNNLSNLSTGLYIVKILFQDGNFITKKIIKK